MKTETHHNHVLIEDKDGIIKWKEDPMVTKILEKINLGHLLDLFRVLGLNKNSEVWRHLYRCIGFSIHAYYDVFYHKLNNPDHLDYVQPTDVISVFDIRKVFEIIKDKLNL